MKKTLLVLLLAILVAAVWLALRQPKLAPRPAPIVEATPIPTANTQVSMQPSTNSLAVPLFPVPSTNVIVRTSSVDEETWNRWLAYRQFILDRTRRLNFMLA